MPRELQRPCEILTLLFETGDLLVETGDLLVKGLHLGFEIGGMLVKGLLLGFEIGDMPAEGVLFRLDARHMLAEGVLFRLDARHTPSLVLEKRPKQRRRAVERLSNLIECAHCVESTAVCAFLEQQVHRLTRLSYPIGQRRRYVQSLDSYFVVAKVFDR